MVNETRKYRLARKRVVLLCPLKIVIIVIILLALATAVIARTQKPGSADSSSFTPSALIELTPKEKAWLENHRIIRLGMSPVFPPLKFTENGVIKGIEPDYLQLLAEYTGIKFEYVICDFSVMDAKVKSGEIDMFLSFNIPERLAYMRFTEPFMEFKQVIVTRSDAPFISMLGALKGKKIATVKGVKLYDKILASYPDIERVQVDTMEQMFVAVAESRADALISRTYNAGYLLNNFPNLKIAGVADLPPEPFLYAVRKDYPELAGILNKAIKVIPKDKHDAIIQKWFSLRLEYRPNRAEFIHWILMGGGIFSVILGLTLYWNRRLRQEIDKRRQTETSLRENEERLAFVLKGSHQGFWDWNIESGEVVRNDQWAEMLGYTLKEIEFSVNQWTDLIHPDDRDLAFQAINNHLAGVTPVYEMEYRMLTKDGKYKWILDRARIVQYDANGRAVRMCGTHTDITELKEVEAKKLQLEQQFHQTQKLESLGILAGGIAHDFNNILAVIAGYCGIVRLRPEKMEEHLLQIEKSVERAAALCRQMLTYAGQSRFVIAQVNAALLVNEMVSMLQATIPQNVVIKPELTADLPLVNGDAGHLRQIVVDLIMNAVEAIGDAKGEIRVSLAKAEIQAGKEIRDHLNQTIQAGFYVCLEVTDTGCGMNGETMARIFEPFYSTKFMGRGLGMSAVLGSIKAHQGAVQLFSRPGQGTMFRIYLPVQSSSAKEESPSQAAHEAWQGEGTIMLVEDEEQLRLIAKNMLELLGFTVIEASNGKEALELYQINAAAITLVMTDVGMPVMDGYELVRELRRCAPMLPIIVSSGFGEMMVSSRLASENLAGLISKPYRFEQLQQIVQSVVPSL